MISVTIDNREANEAEAKILARLCPPAFRLAENQGKPIKHFTWHYAWSLAKQSPCMI